MSRRWQRLRVGLPYVGIAVFAALVAWLDSSSTFTYRGGLVLASMAGLLLVACLPGRPSTYTELMRLRPLAWVGERSYGLYLWHWPVLLIVIELRGSGSAELDASASTAIIVVAITLALTEMSYQWIEAPIRNNGYRATVSAVGARLRASGQLWPRLAAVGAVAVVAMAAMGLAGAPDQTEVQVGVEEGQALIESQAAPTLFDAEAITRSAAEATNDITPPAAPAWPPRRDLPAGTSMVGLGDSVMSGAAPALFSRFDGIYLEATPNLQWRDAPGMVDRLLRDGVMRPVVVLSFGTNAGLESQESIDALRATLDALGPERRVVLVDVVGISFWVPSTNQTLRSIAAEYPNAIVADWNTATSNNPGLLHDDRTHPNMAGIEVYTDVVSSALRQLGPR